MEDPKTFSAPLTSFNDESVSADKKPTHPVKESESNVDLQNDEQDKKDGVDPSKTGDSDHGVKSEAEVEKTAESHNDFHLAICRHCGSPQSDSVEKADSHSGDNVEGTAKGADLEANVSASSQTSESDQKKEDQAEDPNAVDWDGPDDPKNPMNWPAWKINAQIFLVSAITFIR